MKQGFGGYGDCLAGRTSTLFIVLVTVVCCAFGYFFNLLWEPYSEQRRVNVLEQAEQVQVTGNSTNRAATETKRRVTNESPTVGISYRDRKDAIGHLNAAIIAGDVASFAEHIAPLLANAATRSSSPNI